MEYCENTSTAADIAKHLKSCDPAFYNALAGRIDINAYAEKLAAKSFRHEIWLDDQLVGLIAVYYNNAEDVFSFITDVSVSADRIGHGIATKLLQKSIERTALTKNRQLKLEVGKSNYAAINLYRKFGFIEAPDNDDFVITMLLSLEI